MPCPDCLGSGVWAWTSPVGKEGTVQCPRCRGQKSLGMHCNMPHVRELTIGSVRTDSAEPDHKQISYMCEETGVGSGSVYYEGTLFLTEVEANAEAATLVAAANAKIEEAQPERAELRDLNEYTMQDALVKAAKIDAAKWRSRLHTVLERICGLDTYNTVGERFCQEDRHRSSHLKEEQIGPLQESLVWLSDYGSDYLERHRNEDEV